MVLSRKQTSIGILVMLALLAFYLSISLGSVMIPATEIPGYLTGYNTENPAWVQIINQFRLPKAITGILAGAGLGISGLIMQTLFRNPLAGPFVLGVSSGASLGVALTIMTGIVFFASVPGQWVVITAAGSGAALTLLLVLAISFRTRDTMSLLIVGLMIGSITSAVISILQMFSNSEEIKVYLLWTFGNLGGLDWGEISILTPLIIVGIALTWYISSSMNTFLLSENYARSMGVNTMRIRIWIIVITSILAGSITAFCGPIAFVGIAVPHITRMILNTSDHRWLIPGVILLGTIILLVCDLIASLPGLDQILPLNAVTSIIGAPVVIWLIIRRKSISKTFGG